VFDTCGTGGDRAGTINVSTAAAVVLAGAGVRVAKHGNRSVSSQCGSADVFEALGVGITAPPAVVSRSLDEANVAFLFAPSFHPAMKHAAPTRKELGLRTAFNLLGPLTNPAAPSRQIVGVPRPELTELLARALLMLGSERVWVVHGADGLDEISTTGYTKVSEGFEGTVRTFHVHPGDFGLKKATIAAIAGGDARTNARVLVDLLDGQPGPVRDIVLLNAGAGLFLTGRVTSIRDGIAEAGAAIDSGRAKTALESLVRVTTEGRTA
jgi:anthranilate phosphoribosyltransferase